MDWYRSRWHGVDRDIRVQRARYVLAFVLHLHIDLVYYRTKICVVMYRKWRIKREYNLVFCR